MAEGLLLHTGRHGLSRRSAHQTLPQQHGRRLGAGLLPLRRMHGGQTCGSGPTATAVAASADGSPSIQPAALAQPPTQPPPSGKATVAVIDIGTSSFHLVVVRASTGDQRRLEVIDQVCCQHCTKLWCNALMM